MRIGGKGGFWREMEGWGGGLRKGAVLAGGGCRVRASGTRLLIDRRGSLHPAAHSNADACH